MSRAVLFTRAQEPFRVVDYPDPEPMGGEIRVRIRCCTICRSDLHTHSGRRVQPSPTILGHEITGRIDAFGPDARRVDAAGQPAEIGTRVTWAIAVGCGDCFYCQDDLPQKCEKPFKFGHTQVDPQRPLGGGLADTVMLTPLTQWFCVPDSVSDSMAAPANCATATVAGLLRTAGTIANRSVLVLGAGVLGVTACAMAQSLGASRVMVCDPSAESQQRAREFGATDTSGVDPSDQRAMIADATAGRGADVVLELAGVASSVQSAMQLARIGGQVILAGTVAPTPGVTFDPEQVVKRMLRISGVHNYHPRDLRAALDFLAGPGRAYPFESLVSRRYALAEVDAAFSDAHAHPGVRIAVMPQLEA
ncbi:zinc-binding dehydrogenase [Tuwongella immobilis]|uniref:alcohol dehydrogenase n=1 Tax=Tuwongella immobilis TaxID=692036 RepID=A0A6C2YSV9_9BACT|nr:zinc-binding dehydrogenase [Tuwongella immobilis]VIP04800.1 phosphonate catabolism associated alcohol dehydrogenase : Putative phosphonate catabolism associated alcohol dehydrogenase OS=Singulisphaera acidiphila (strain ATCC BAA-1392 / DSM 18658 / VKM B-2454 / MOB10) GN=Sinac_0393 PE=4 SV=1: ADH_N: ADH_zinc_N [Tuwongella immobilis]VTS06960.1 phosphonate catabolism associated alcohol dehydrogenase : Putative phosphonate catabolism associated alcohol dehydrogenase OS=Singulisphaera acidiphila (s